MIAVLTGDLVNSTQLDKTSYAATLNTLRNLLEEAKSRYHANYEIYRGDGFQLAYPTPLNAMRSALIIKLGLLAMPSKKPCHVTLSLGVGDVQHIDNSVGNSSGPAFTASGRGLDATPKGHLSLHIDKPMSTQDLHIATQFLNHHFAGLSQKQALVGFYYLSLDYPEQHVIAQRLDMTRQNVATHLKRGAFALIKNYIEGYEMLFNATTGPQK